MYDDRHFKLTNGEEILCQVVEWNGDDTPDILIRNAMKIVSVQSPDGSFYHSFKPWMLFIDQPDNLITLNHMQVIGEALPNKTVLEQYQKALEYHWENSDAIKGTSDEDPIEKLRQVLEEMGAISAEDLFNDSDGGDGPKIVKFNPKKKLH
jgi:hypothetical protein